MVCEVLDDTEGEICAGKRPWQHDDREAGLRILYIHQYFNTPAMSGGTRSYELGRRLVASAHSVTMVTSDRAGSSRVEERVAGMDVVWLPVRYSQGMSYRRRMAAFGGFAAAAARESMRHDFDVVFATSTPLTTAIPGAAAARRRRVSLVLEIRDLWPEMPIAVGALNSPLEVRVARLLEGFAYSQADQIVALSPAMAEGIARTGYSPSRITIIPNGCDVEMFAVNRGVEPPKILRESEVGDRRIALYFGAIGQVNGLEYLVDVAEELRLAGSPLAIVVIGDGHKRASVLDRATRIGVLGESFFVLPAQPKSEMPRLLAWADVALSIFAPIPEMEANSSNKFFDALAAGRPIALNYGGWHRELVEQNGCGVFLPRDPMEAASVLEDFTKDQALLESAGAAARRLAERKFSRDDHARQLEAVLLRAVR